MIMRNSDFSKRETTSCFFPPEPQNMSTPSSTMAAGIALGGVAIASVGAASTYFVEKTKPTVKSLMRDFIIGCVLVLMILQLLPDSMQFLTSLLPSVTSVKTGMESIMSGGAEVANEMEIQVGLPRF
uniref:Uncharacterized protein n=1 Tax=viral metagenome TaxID=1070528 RepID=A0A6C0BB25_9ZZZZ